MPRSQDTMPSLHPRPAKPPRSLGYLMEEAMPPMPKGVTPPSYWYPRTEWPTRQEAKEAYQAHHEVIAAYSGVIERFHSYCPPGRGAPVGQGPEVVREVYQQVATSYKKVLRSIRTYFPKEQWGGYSSLYKDAIKQFQQHGRRLEPVLRSWVEALDLGEALLHELDEHLTWLDHEMFIPTVPQAHPLLALIRIQDMEDLVQDLLVARQQAAKQLKAVWDSILHIQHHWHRLLDGPLPIPPAAKLPEFIHVVCGPSKYASGVLSRSLPELHADMLGSEKLAVALEISTPQHTRRLSAGILSKNRSNPYPIRTLLHDQEGSAKPDAFTVPTCRPYDPLP